MDCKEFFKRDIFASEAGIILEEVIPGSAKASLTVEKRHLNAGGVAQGGAIFTLSDLAMAAAVNSHGILAFSIQSDIRFLEPAREGDTLTATAVEKLLKKSIAHYSVSVTNQNDVVIALMDGICYRKIG